ncbi:hypothetical protein [uncultured Rikenella sp.]|uniref:hypothetical protein n=1 Tax=uncultured Rikenella sp. TaxID=368003 RepID=UPI00272AB9AC|nr:hypothetical protein [uncultured Rikenella sp.]
MEKVTKEQAEAAVQTVRQLKIQASELAGRIKDAEAVVEAYSVEHLGEFADGRLALDAGIIALKAGTAKPVKEGKPLSTAARAELAAALPAAYVKVACDFGVLFQSQDKAVRQILKARGIEIVREDRFVVL